MRNIFTRMGLFIRDNGRKTIDTDMEFRYGPMVRNMKVIGKKTWQMDTESSGMLMETPLMVFLELIK